MCTLGMSGHSVSKVVCVSLGGFVHLFMCVVILFCRDGIFKQTVLNLTAVLQAQPPESQGYKVDPLPQ